jgi:hypothetical protein
MFLRHHPRRVRQPVANPREDQPVVPAEALTAPYWLQQKQRQQISLRQSPATGPESYFTSTIRASIRWGKRRIGGRTHKLHLRIRNTKGEQIDLILHLPPQSEPPLRQRLPLTAQILTSQKVTKKAKTGVPHPCRVLCDRVGILTFLPRSKIREVPRLPHPRLPHLSHPLAAC